MYIFSLVALKTFSWWDDEILLITGSGFGQKILETFLCVSRFGQISSAQRVITKSKLFINIDVGLGVTIKLSKIESTPHKFVVEKKM